MNHHVPSRHRRALLAALTTVTLALAGCSSWDGRETTTDSSNSDLISEIQGSGKDVNPRELRGVSTVGALDEVKPVADNPEPQLPVELTDNDGNDVKVEDASRIVALDIYGTYTETLRGLGLGENIVGRSSSSTEASLQDLPVVTQSGHDINVEAVLSLEPTLIVVDHSIGPAGAIDQLRDSGVPTVVMSPDRSPEKLGESIRNLAGVVGLPDEGDTLAQQSTDEYDEAIRTIKEIAPERPLKMAFFYARGEGGVFYVLGKEASTDDLISALGGKDVATDNRIGAPSPANAEALAKLNPDVFVMMSHGLESAGQLQGLLTRPGVAQTTAGKNQRILALPDGDSLAFGPQTGEMLLRAAHALYQENGELM